MEAVTLGSDLITECEYRKRAIPVECPNCEGRLIPMIWTKLYDWDLAKQADGEFCDFWKCVVCRTSTNWLPDTTTIFKRQYRRGERPSGDYESYERPSGDWEETVL